MAACGEQGVSWQLWAGLSSSLRRCHDGRPGSCGEAQTFQALEGCGRAHSWSVGSLTSRPDWCRCLTALLSCRVLLADLEQSSLAQGVVLGKGSIQAGPDSLWQLVHDGAQHIVGFGAARVEEAPGIVQHGPWHAASE